MKEREMCVHACVRASRIWDASFWLKLVPRGRRCTRGVNALARARGRWRKRKSERESESEWKRGGGGERSNCDGKGGWSERETDGTGGGRQRESKGVREIVKVRRPTIDPTALPRIAPWPPKQRSEWSLNASSASSQSQPGYLIFSSDYSWQWEMNRINKLNLIFYQMIAIPAISNYWNSVKKLPQIS